MWEDPIVEEIRRIRETHAAKFNYDIDAIFEDLKKFEKEHPELNWVTLPPKKPEPVSPRR